jgi:hypothetical protein
VRWQEYWAHAGRLVKPLADGRRGPHIAQPRHGGLKIDGSHGHEYGLLTTSGPVDGLSRLERALALKQA